MTFTVAAGRPRRHRLRRDRDRLDQRPSRRLGRPRPRRRDGALRLRHDHRATASARPTSSSNGDAGEQWVAARPTGLAPNTTYHARLVSVGADGTQASLGRRDLHQRARGGPTLGAAGVASVGSTTRRAERAGRPERPVDPLPRGLRRRRLVRPLERPTSTPARPRPSPTARQRSRASIRRRPTTTASSRRTPAARATGADGTFTTASAGPTARPAERPAPGGAQRRGLAGGRPERPGHDPARRVRRDRVVRPAQRRRRRRRRERRPGRGRDPARPHPGDRLPPAGRGDQRQRHPGDRRPRSSAPSPRVRRVLTGDAARGGPQRDVLRPGEPERRGRHLPLRVRQDDRLRDPHAGRRAARPATTTPTPAPTSSGSPPTPPTTCAWWRPRPAARAPATTTTFATDQPGPSVATGSAGAITGYAASIAGTVNPNGLATTYRFEYGPTTAYGSVTATQSLAAGYRTGAVAAALAGLLPGRTYHYRVAATNASGTKYGDDATLATTALPPDVTTGAASGLGTHTATVALQVNPNGDATSFRIEYGPTTAYQQQAVGTGVGSGTGVVTAMQSLTGLAPGTLYHYRVVAGNGAGETAGQDATFRTVALTAPLLSSVARERPDPHRRDHRGERRRERAGDHGHGRVRPVDGLRELERAGRDRRRRHLGPLRPAARRTRSGDDLPLPPGGPQRHRHDDHRGRDLQHRAAAGPGRRRRRRRGHRPQPRRRCTAASTRAASRRPGGSSTARPTATASRPRPSRPRRRPTPRTSPPR